MLLFFYTNIRRSVKIDGFFCKNHSKKEQCIEKLRIFAT